MSFPKVEFIKCTGGPLLLTLLFSNIQATAQVCVPDSSYHGHGLNPDSVTGIAPAMEGYYYLQEVTVIIPGDTMITIGSQTYNAIIDSVILKDVIGLPSWVEILCEPPDCKFLGDSYGCAVMRGTAPFGSAGDYVLDVATINFGRLNGSTHISPRDTAFGYYTMRVMPYSGLTEVGARAAPLSVSPNPAFGRLMVRFGSDKHGTAEIVIFDQWGGSVASVGIHISEGANSVELDGGTLPQGLYSLRLSFPDNRRQASGRFAIFR